MSCISPATGESASSSPTELSALYRTKVSCLSVAETLRLLGIGRTSFYKLVKKGDIKIIKFGRRSLVRLSDLDAFLTCLQNRGAM